MTPASNQSDRDELAAALAAALASNAALLQAIAKLEARVAELERRLGLDSSNSSKPPSSDGPKGPTRTASLHRPSGKKSGGQKGHKGDTLRQSATPDIVVDHHPQACAGCGAALTSEMSEGHAARQVFDLPEPQPLEITERRAHACRCARCGETTRAAFPEGVDAPVQYGARIAAFVVYLLHYQFIAEDRLKQLMQDLFGVGLSCATIAGMSRACASRLKDFAEALCDRVARADVKHMDKTDFRIGGKTQWLHVACTSLPTFYRVCAKRGALLSDIVEVVGVIVHDHWKPYYTMDGVRHALCNAHHLRELKAPIDIEKEDWAHQMQILLRRACHATNLARERGVALKPRFVARIKRRYDAVVRRFRHDPIGHLHRQKTGLEHPPNPHLQPRRVAPGPPRNLTSSTNLGNHDKKRIERLNWKHENAKLTAHPASQRTLGRRDARSDSSFAPMN
ncbi:IS66 family transposase [Methylosinus sp. Sm6]|uniref:IS66 family transposase n=1 Tax=Methylosinus sp. Sm6 TaxID=2866948 RepID=UPI001C999B09|nr:IS66 family transposase [Methylosinus sp. Sm6]MBY6243014.1 IS66 family transposase [Methylosinus sp. Sm6]